MAYTSDNTAQWGDIRRDLISALESLGYPAELGNLIAEHIGSPKGIQRMISYLYRERPEKVELIVDEMLAIKSDVNRWRELKETEQINIAYNNVLNGGLDD